MGRGRGNFKYNSGGTWFNKGLENSGDMRIATPSSIVLRDAMDII